MTYESMTLIYYETTLLSRKINMESDKKIIFLYEAPQTEKHRNVL